jgi:tetratricopeptide (TPR) repeat protein
LIRRFILVLLAASLLAAQPAIDHELAQAHQAEVAGNLSAAESIYRNLLKTNPSADVAQRLGLVRHLQNRFAAAAEAFSTALRLDPKLWSSHLFLGIDLYRLNRFPEALTHLQTAERLHPDFPETQFWLGATLIASHEYMAGLENLETVLTRQPANADALKLLAETYANYGTAIQNEVAERYPTSAAASMIEGKAFEFEGSYREALQAFRTAAAKDPNLPGIREAIARVDRLVQTMGR